MACSPTTRRKHAKRGFFQPMTRHESDRITEELARRFASSAGPFSEALLALLDSRNYAGLADFSIDYSHTVFPHYAAAARSCLALFQKNDDLQLGRDREATAWETFAKAELKCGETNARFRAYREGDFNPRAESWIFQVSRKISHILGPCPSLDHLHFSFGPGASSTCKRKTSARRKLATLPVCSKEAYQSAKQLMADFPHWSQHYDNVIGVGPGELTFVPKNAKTYRSIMIEPLLNTFVQKGIGSYIKRRLLSAGCNLYDQERNRSLAQKGAYTGLLATVDLSSASDLISKEVVADLLPFDWWILLSNWRTGSVVYKKRGLEFEFEKFSSMGNAFTFELESVIFYAVALVATERVGSSLSDVSVFGDDIIVPVEAYEALCEGLDVFGFEVNSSKSYASGPFRESCGKDYYLLQDIRPFYCKGRWTYARLVALHNHLRGSEFDDKDLREYIVRLIPAVYRLYGPPGYGDGHLHGSYIGEAKWDNGYSGFIFSTFQKQKNIDSSDPLPSDWLLPLYTTYVSEHLEVRESRDFDPFVIRGDTGKSRKVKVYILGPAS